MKLRWRITSLGIVHAFAPRATLSLCGYVMRAGTSAAKDALGGLDCVECKRLAEADRQVPA